MSENSMVISEAGYQAANGGILYYTEVQGEGKQPLILLHGSGMCREDFEALFPALAGSYHIYAVDWFGHGRSTKNKSLYNCMENSSAIVDFMRDVVGEPCIIAAHSVSGLFASYAAGQAPELVKGLMLEDPPFFAAWPGEIEVSIAYKDSIGIVHDFLRQDEEKDFVIYYLQNSYIFNIPGHDFAVSTAENAREQRRLEPGKLPEVSFISKNILYGLKYIDQVDLNAIDAYATGEWYGDLDQIEILKEVSCPVTFMKTTTRYDKEGTLMSASSEEGAAIVEETLKDCVRIDIRCGHDMHFARPEQYINAINELAKRCDER